jgi:Raf kinase inhibitor-like YbhB/YbcL family protein
VVVVALSLAACGGNGSSTAPSAAGFELSSTTVEAGGTIPVELTCDGEDASPALSWAGAPDGTAGFALVLEDPDAPGGTFTHWLLWGLPASATSLPAGLAAQPVAVAGGTEVSQGENDFGEVGDRGPCPPEGEEHRYAFRLLALDDAVELPEPGAGLGALEDAVEGHVLAEARLEATYAREAT